MSENTPENRPWPSQAEIRITPVLTVRRDGRNLAIETDQAVARVEAADIDDFLIAVAKVMAP